MAKTTNKATATAKAKEVKKEITQDEVQVKEQVEEKVLLKELEPTIEENKWEVKDRTYILKNGLSPITFQLKSKSIYWFDEEKEYERELKYTTNQKTPFVDEFKGDGRLAHIVFEDGVLHVPRNKQVLQKLLSLYHPGLNKVYTEYNSVQEAEDELEVMELEFEAQSMARNMDLGLAEAIVRVEVGAKVATMTAQEIKKDLFVFAKKNPKLFLELANDENVELRSIGLKAVEQRVIKLSSDQSAFEWTNSGRILTILPPDENPYSALANWFKTDDGMTAFKIIQKKVK